MFVNRGGRESAVSVSPHTSLYGYERRQMIGQDANNLFTRLDVDTAAIGNALLTDTTNLAIMDWQLWAQSSWKTEHGTPESALRFGTKLEEEYAELLAAVHDLLTNRHGDVVTAKKAVLSEAGDVLWCGLSGVSNANVAAEDTLQNYLYELTMGTVFIENGVPLKTPWDDIAGKIALKKIEPVTVGDIDSFLDTGYIPQFSLAMNVFSDDLEEEDPPYSYVRRLQQAQLYPRELSYLQLQQYGVDEQLEPYIFQGREGFDSIGKKIGNIFSALFFDVVYATRGLTGARFDEIIKTNYEKITGRVVANLIDHSDGDRPIHLL